MKKRKKTKLQPKDVTFREIHGQLVTVNVYPTTRKGYKKSLMTTSGRMFKREPMTMAEKRREGFCK